MLVLVRGSHKIIVPMNFSFVLYGWCETTFGILAKDIWTWTVVGSGKLQIVARRLLTVPYVLEHKFTAYAQTLYVHLFLSLLHLVHRSMLQKSIWPKCLSSHR